jgi:PAB-dependent poly(A)-specific ribonuclease subunit 3
MPFKGNLCCTPTFAELNSLVSYTDVLESELGGEIENGRIVRLLSKLGFINERAE